MVYLQVKSAFTNEELQQRAKQNGILVFASPTETPGYANIALSCCEVPVEEFHNAALLLKEVVEI